MNQAKLTPEEISERGEEIYARNIRERMRAEDIGKVVVIDITTGEYEIDRDHVAAATRMLAHSRGEDLYGIRVGSPVFYKLGGHSQSVAK